MVGRVHFYEGLDIQTVAFPTRVLTVLNISTLIVTNAAGGLNSSFKVGDIMLLNDHINLPGLAGNHPLRGLNEEAFGTRFPALSDAYDLEYRRAAHLAWKKLSVKGDRTLQEGVYMFASGPTFETRAECRMLKMWGADVVGMSTVPEICCARHAGLRVLAFSLVTNCAVIEPGPRGDSLLVENMGEEGLKGVLELGKANHAEVLETGKEAAKDLCSLVTQFVDDISA